MTKKGVVFAARDKSGKLFLYHTPPVKLDLFGVWTGDIFLERPEDELPYVKWEDTEPTRIRITWSLNHDSSD